MPLRFLTSFFRFSFCLLAAMLIFYSTAEGKSRNVFLDKELSSAAFAGEVIIDRYDTSRSAVSGKLVVETMSCHTAGDIRNPLHFTTRTDWEFYPSYKLKPATGDPFFEEGYWPAPGDTVLLVTDSLRRVSLFAAVENDDYIFWSPYSTDSWTTVFYFNHPATALPDKQHKPSAIKGLQKTARSLGYESAAYYHCRLARKDLLLFRPQDKKGG